MPRSSRVVKSKKGEKVRESDPDCESKIVSLPLPDEPFSQLKAFDLFQNGMLKDNLDCKQYIEPYVYPLITGEQGFYDAHKKVILMMTKEQVKSAHFDGLPKIISDWWFKTPRQKCHQGFDLNAGPVYEKDGMRFINSFAGFRFHEPRTPTKSEKKGIELLWNHV